jgi:hypothetical protein
MITEEQYLNSLKIVRSYLKQIKKEIYPIKKTSYTEFRNKIEDDVKNCGSEKFNYSRLINILKHNESYYDCIEDIRINDFKCYRNAGPKAWKLFTEIRGF